VAEALWMHVKKYHAPDNFNVYAHYIAIIQSSGMEEQWMSLGKNISQYR
jgi:hypothetical protein